MTPVKKIATTTGDSLNHEKNRTNTLHIVGKLQLQNRCPVHEYLLVLGLQLKYLTSR